MASIHRKLTYIPLLVGLGGGAALAACSESSTDGSTDDLDPTGSGGTGGTDIRGPDAGNDAAVPVVRSDLPPPWQYFHEDGRFGFKQEEVPDDVRDAFGGPTTGASPEIAYPLSDSLHPMNSSAIAIHWRAGGSGQRYFRVVLESGEGTFELYGACSTPACVFDVPESEWIYLGQNHAGREVTLRVEETNEAGSPVGVSEPVTLHFSPEPVLGAAYYWASEQRSIKRAAINATSAVTFIAPLSDTNDYQCAGCHSVSRDGSVIAFAVCEENGEDIAAIQTAPTQDPTQPYVRPQKGTTPWLGQPIAQENTEGPVEYTGSTVALSPDGALAAINGLEFGETWPIVFEIRDTMSGTTLERHEIYDPIFAPGDIAILPEWAPDGRSLVVTLDRFVDGMTWSFAAGNSEIAIMPYDSGSLGSPRVVVPKTDELNHYYPTWSPDGRYLAFVSATGHSVFNPDGVLRMVPAEGGPHACPGPTCWELARGQQVSAGSFTTWPKFAPFLQDEGNLMFLSFTSKIDYGVVSEGRTYMWLFGIDLRRLDQGDPSFAPVWLPWQDEHDSSMTPYWTEILPCEQDPEGGCQGCVQGETCLVDRDNNCSCFGLLPE